MERTVKLGDLIEVDFREPVLTPDGYKKVGYAYVSKLDVKFGDNAIGFDAKYLNPMGLKPTISSRFEKPAKEIDFLNHEVLLMRSPKPYEKNQVAFRVNPFMSKPEIK